MLTLLGTENTCICLVLGDVSGLHCWAPTTLALVQSQETCKAYVVEYQKHLLLFGHRRRARLTLLSTKSTCICLVLGDVSDFHCRAPKTFALVLSQKTCQAYIVGHQKKNLHLFSGRIRVRLTFSGTKKLALVWSQETCTLTMPQSPHRVLIFDNCLMCLVK